MIWNPATELMPRSELDALQSRRLANIFSYVYDRVPFYKQAFDSHGVQPEQINDLGDIERLPFTTKHDLRDNYPYDMFAVPLRAVARLHASSGTTGMECVRWLATRGTILRCGPKCAPAVLV